jgi:hypothetical protein
MFIHANNRRYNMEDKAKKKEKKKHNWLSVLIQVLIGCGIGFVAGIFLVGKLFSSKLTLIDFLVFILFIFTAYFINVNIHEFGHFIFGRIFGYRLVSYRISFLTWNNENGKMKFQLIKNQGYSGLCAMVPPEQELEDYKNVLFYSGGLLLNVISGTLFLLAGSLIINLGAGTKLFLNTVGIFALFLAITNFIPFVSGNNPTDGKLIWSLVLKKPFAKKLIELNKMSSQLAAGIRPRDLEISLSADMDNLQPFDMAIIIYSYFKALDNQNYEDMLHYTALFEENIEVFPSMVLPSVYYELCYMGCISKDEDKANEYYKKAGKILQGDKDVNGLRVKAYYEYYINNDEKAAAIFCENALAVADKFPFKGQGKMEKDLVLVLSEKVK